ncbi:MAG: tetratricopeptide repeat protein [Thermoanaerobaculia bacterium]
MIPAGGLERSTLLLEQGRYDLAEKELRRQLTEDHQDALAHALLAFCLMKQERLPEAEREAREAVALAPDAGFSHFHLGQVLDHRDRLVPAAAAFQEAIRLDPEDADYPAALASIRVQQRRWDEAMAAVEQGLELDPDHAGCTNLRALILTHTGKTGEAHSTLDDALARDPENAFTHANRGWTLLRESRPKEAIEHFREALRLEPSFEYARIGIVEAMKARNPIYRPILRFFLWLGSLQGRSQMWLILGLFFGARLLRLVARSQPSLAPFLYPVLFLYMAFVLLTWVADPLFNLLLRLDRFGRLALSREQVRASNWFGGVLGLALAALVAGLATGSEMLLLVALGAGALILPVTAVFRCRPGWPRQTMAGYTALLVVLMALALWVDEISAFLGIALIGAVLSTWIGSGLALAGKQSRG